MAMRAVLCCGLAIALSGCAKPVPIEDIRSQVGAGLLVAAPIARILASESDRGDGAIGCIVGEALGSSFEAAGKQLATGQHDPTASVSICECLALRDDWQALDVSVEMASQAAAALEAVSILISPQIRSCEAKAWLSASSQAVAMLLAPIAEALTLEQCSIPIPPIVPDLEACHG